MPDLASLMGGAGVGGPEQGPPSIQVGDHPDSQTTAQKLAEVIPQILDDVRAALSASDADPAEKLELEKITTQLQSMLAQHHKQEQAALGGGPATQFLKRASGS